MPKILSLLVLCLLCSCAAPSFENEGALRHAQLLTLDEHDDYTLATVRNPWDTTTVLHRYVLVPSNRSLPRSLPDGTLLRTPLTRCIIGSTVHAALAQQLAIDSVVAGICDAEYVVSERLKKANFTAVGSSMQPNLESIVALNADALWLSPFENAGYGALSQLGIPIIECADYMESTPLGRAEWMRFYGRLWGCGERADSLFNLEETHYNTLQTRIATAKIAKPRLLIDKKEGAVWYVPGGKSYLSTLFRDAGAKYVFANRDIAGSVALDFEIVYAEARTADVWVIKYGANAPLSYASMQRDLPAYTEFKAFSHKNIWACNTLVRPYYEELPFAPSRLLNEWIAVLHPQLLSPSERPQHPYFQPLHAQ